MVAVILIFGLTPWLVFRMVTNFHNVRNSERLAMIEKGVELQFEPPAKDSKTTLKFGFLGMGVALGILLGYLLTDGFGMQEEVAYFSMILLVGGASLFGFYLFDKKENSKQK